MNINHTDQHNTVKIPDQNSTNNYVSVKDLLIYPCVCVCVCVCVYSIYTQLYAY